MRWGRFTWFAAWVIAQGIQVAAVSSVSGDSTAMGIALVVTQLLKIPLSIPRLNDLGRPADDAVAAILPLFNVVVFFRLFGGTPSDDLRDRRRRSWSSQLSSFQAFGIATRTLVATLGAALPVTLLVAVVGIGASEGLISWVEYGMATEGVRVARAESLTLLLLGLSLYSFVNLVRRVLRPDSVTRASWLASLAVLPTLLVVIALYTAPQLSTQAGMVIGGLPLMASDLLIWPLLSGLLVGTWVRAGRQVMRPDTPEDAPTGTWREISAVSGGRTQAVAIGMQMLFVPGIFLSITWAFADLAAAVSPGERAFAYSSRLARGVYDKLFKMLAVYFVMVVGLDMIVMSPWASPDLVLQSLIGVPGLIGSEARMAASFARILASWWCTLAFLAVYLERDELYVAFQKRQEAAE
jgi:hypothetical protein